MPTCHRLRWFKKIPPLVPVKSCQPPPSIQLLQKTFWLNTGRRSLSSRLSEFVKGRVENVLRLCVCFTLWEVLLSEDYFLLNRSQARRVEHVLRSCVCFTVWECSGPMSASYSTVPKQGVLRTFWDRVFVLPCESAPIQWVLLTEPFQSTACGNVRNSCMFLYYVSKYVTNQGLLQQTLASIIVDAACRRVCGFVRGCKRRFQITYFSNHSKAGRVGTFVTHVCFLYCVSKYVPNQGLQQQTF